MRVTRKIERSLFVKTLFELLRACLFFCFFACVYRRGSLHTLIDWMGILCYIMGFWRVMVRSFYLLWRFLIGIFLGGVRRYITKTREKKCNRWHAYEVNGDNIRSFIFHTVELSLYICTHRFFIHLDRTIFAAERGKLRRKEQ